MKRVDLRSFQRSLFLHGKIELLASEVNEKLNLIFVSWRCRNFLHSHQRRPVPSWHLRQWYSTARYDVNLIRWCELFILEVAIWNNFLRFFPRFFVTKHKPAYSYSYMSLFVSALFNCLKDIFGLLLRGQPDLTDINHCIFNSNMTQNSPVVHGM